MAESWVRCGGRFGVAVGGSGRQKEEEGNNFGVDADGGRVVDRAKRLGSVAGSGRGMSLRHGDEVAIPRHWTHAGSDRASG